MVLALEDDWIWDSWYAHDGEKWHAYFLKAPKSIGDSQKRHFNVSQGHAVSTDLVNWEHLGTTFAPSEGPAFDDMATWTGCVLQDPEGLWHLFYTGCGSAEQGLYQRLGHATSRDMHSWERVGDGLILDLIGPNADAYERDHAIGTWHNRAMRDPWVIKDPEGEGWLMYFTARVPSEGQPSVGGAVGFATSPDLYNWTLQKPAFSGVFGEFEVPQVFQLGAIWYCLFCTKDIHWSAARAAETGLTPVKGSHYLMADSPHGPWRVAPGFFDGALPCRRYAAHILETEHGLVIMGFDDNGRETFVGHVLDPEPVTVDAEGYLHVKPQVETAV